MKKISFLLLFIFPFSFTIFGQNSLASSKQNNKIRGTVLLQNSSRTIVEGVQIYAKGANPKQSDTNGKFTLEFSRKRAGAKAGLDIGSSSGDNKSIEWVNQKEIEQARIPKDPNDSIFIIVCSRGTLAKARQKYYNAIDHQLNKNYRKKIAKIDQLISQVGENKNKIIALNQERDSIDLLYQKTLNSLDDMSDYLATLNKDFASEMVKEAIELIEKEQDIDKALAILDGAKLEEAYLNAVDKKMAAKEEIRQVVEGFKLRSNLLSAEFRYQEAADAYTKIIEIVEANVSDFSQTEHLEHIIKGAERYMFCSQFEQGVNLCKKGIGIIGKEELLDTMLAYQTYDLAGALHLGLNQYKEGIVYLKKANALLSHLSHETVYPILVYETNYHLGNSYKFLSDYRLAIQHKLVAFDQVKDEMDPASKHYEYTKFCYISITQSLSSLYNLIGDYEKGQKFASLSVKYLDENDLKNPIANFFRLYHLASIKANELKHKEAIELSKEALEFAEKNLSGDYISSYLIQNVLTNSYTELGQWKEAEHHALKVIEFCDNHFPDDNLATLRANLKYGTIKLFSGGKYKEAIQIMNKPLIELNKELDASFLFDTYVLLILAYSLNREEDKIPPFKEKLFKLLEKPEEVINISTTKSFGQLSKTLFLGVDFETAIVLLNRVITVMESRYMSDHPDIANIHLTIGGGYTNTKKNALEKALFHYKKAIDTYVQHPTGYEIQLLEAYSGIAYEYSYADKIESANEYLLLAEEMYQKHLQVNKDKLVVSGFGFGNMSMAYYWVGNYAKALEWNKRSFVEFQVLANGADETSPHFSKVISDELRIRKNLGIILLNQEKYLDALPNFRRCFKIAKKTEDINLMRRELATCYVNISRLHFEAEQPDSAEVYSRLLAEEIKNIPDTFLDQEENLSFGLTMGIYNFKKGANNAALSWVERCKKIILKAANTRKNDLTSAKDILSKIEYRSRKEIAFEQFKEGNYSASIDNYETCIRLLGDIPVPIDLYEFLAFAYGHNTDQAPEKVIEYSEKLLEHYPDHSRPLFFYNYVEALSKAKQIKKAYAFLPKVVVKPSLESLGKDLEIIILTMEGKTDEAVLIVESLYEAGETNWTRFRKDPYLSALLESKRFMELLAEAETKN